MYESVVSGAAAIATRSMTGACLPGDTAERRQGPREQQALPVNTRQRAIMIERSRDSLPESIGIAILQSGQIDLRAEDYLAQHCSDTVRSVAVQSSQRLIL